MMETLRLPTRTRNTIQKIAGIALEYLPLTFSASDLGVGRKVFIPIPLKNKPIEMADFIYVYVESKLPKEPEESELGFTENDIIENTGVYLFRNNGDRVTGKIYSLSTFFRDVIADLSLRNRIIYKIGEMKLMIHLDEEFLDLANMEYLTSRNEPVRTSVHIHSKVLQ